MESDLLQTITLDEAAPMLECSRTDVLDLLDARKIFADFGKPNAIYLCTVKRYLETKNSDAAS